MALLTTRQAGTAHTLPSLITRWQADAKALVRSSSWRLRLLGRISRDGDRRDRNQLGRDRNQLLMTSAMLERQLERLGAPQRLLLTAYCLLLTAYYLLLTTYYAGALQQLLLTRPPPLPASALVSSGGGGGGAGGVGGADGAGVAAGLIGLTGEARSTHDAWQAAAHLWAARARALVAEMIAETLRSGAAGGADETSSARATTAAAAVGLEASEASEVGQASEVDEASEVAAGAAELGSGSRSESGSESGRAQDPRTEEPRAEDLSEAKLEPMEAQLETLLSWARSDATAPTTPEGWAAALSLVASLPEARRTQGFLLPGYAALATAIASPLATSLATPLPPPLPPPYHTSVPSIPPGTPLSLVGCGRCQAPSPSYSRAGACTARSPRGGRSSSP